MRRKRRRQAVCWTNELAKDHLNMPLDDDLSSRLSGAPRLLLLDTVYSDTTTNILSSSFSRLQRRFGMGRLQCMSSKRRPRRDHDDYELLAPVQHSSLTMLLSVLLLLLLHSSQNCSDASSLPFLAKQEQTNSSFVIVRTHLNQLFRGLKLEAPMQTANQHLAAAKSLDKGNAVAAFLGIRYASAPVKRLRFMPPTQFHYAPNQVHDTQHFGPICPQQFPIDFAPMQANFLAQVWQQFNSSNADTQARTLDADQKTRDLQRIQLLLMKKLLPEELLAGQLNLVKQLKKLEQSEDCLNLNIYTPEEALNGKLRTLDNFHELSSRLKTKRESKKSSNGLRRAHQNLRPVLVIIHGESFDLGSGATINAWPFVQHSRQLLVTFNYRLNILGFPPRSLGSAQREQRTNLGLLDQLAALHWIRDHIKSFGGDPNKITLMGEKKGAIFVNLLMLSPLAKGLFQRAIMEDGSALSPLIANQLTSYGNNYQQQLQVNQMHHLRSLAKLNDCPLPSSSMSAFASSQTTTANISNSGSSSKLAHNQQQRLEQITLLECLRSKSLEQIMTRIPLDLLAFNQQNELILAPRWRKHIDLMLGQLRRRLASLGRLDNNGWPTFSASAMLVGAGSNSEQEDNTDNDNTFAGAQEPDNSRLLLGDGGNQRGETDLDNVGDSKQKKDGASANEAPPAQSLPLGDLFELVDSNSRPVRSMSQFCRLIGAILASILIEQPSQQQQPISSLSDNNDQQQQQHQTIESLELLSALYGRDITILGGQWLPLFGPHLDSAILHDDSLLGADLAQSMLKPNSPFSQRDLMLGLNQPLLSAVDYFNPRLFDNSAEQQAEQFQQFEQATRRFFHLRPDQLMVVERLSRQMAQLGLSDEQAIEEVNSFVRSFYKFHQQEITNSIINQYLMMTNAGADHSIGKQTAQQQQQSQYNESDDLNSSNKTKNNRFQQLFVLHSLLEAFQDSLVNVPVIKTALIHSLCQLDTLASAFLSDQQSKLLQHFVLNSSSDLSETMNVDLPNPSELGPDSMEFLFIALLSPESSQQQRSRFNPIQVIGDQFSRFAQRILAQFDNRLKQQDATEMSDTYEDLEETEENGIELHSTYLFQFDSMTLLMRQMSLLLKNHELKQEDQSRAREMFKAFIESGEEFRQHISGFQCIFNTKSDEENERIGSTLDLLERTTCLHLSNVLANFIATGNVNKQWPHFFWPHQSDCSLSTKTNSNSEDHHSVQATPDTSPSKISTDSCRDQMIVELIFDDKLSERSSTQDDVKHWPNFNVYSQQIATLLKPTKTERPVWIVNPISDQHQISKSFNRQQSSPELVSTQQPAGKPEAIRNWPISSARMAFWGNFVPTLNCSRTQPIQPTSLFHSRSSNSTLMNLNLMFNCQSGSQTAATTLSNLNSRIRQELDKELARLRAELNYQINAKKNVKSQNQSHHLPRMTSSSNSNMTGRVDELEVAEGLQQQQQQHLNDQQMISSIELMPNKWPSLNLLLDKIFVPSRDRDSSPLLALWLLAGILICLTLVSGGYFLVRKRNRQLNLSSNASTKIDGLSLDESEKESHEQENNKNQELIVQQNKISTGSCDQPEQMNVSSVSSQVLQQQQQQQQMMMMSLDQFQEMLSYQPNLIEQVDAYNPTQNNQYVWRETDLGSSTGNQTFGFTGNGSMTSLCQKHSAAVMQPNGQSDHQYGASIGTQQDKELILAPPEFVPADIRQQQLYAGSSSEATTTTNTSQVLASSLNGNSNTLKKRVKIHDPLEAMPRQSGRSSILNESANQAANGLQFSGHTATVDRRLSKRNGSQSSCSELLQLNARNDDKFKNSDLIADVNAMDYFCPVHQARSGTYLNVEPVSSSRSLQKQARQNFQSDANSHSIHSSGSMRQISDVKRRSNQQVADEMPLSSNALTDSQQQQLLSTYFNKLYDQFNCSE